MKTRLKQVYSDLRSEHSALRRDIACIRFALFERGRLRRWKNAFAGQRCFIAGNGPSLKQMDLSALKNEKLFVTNRFVLVDGARDLSPSFYCLSDFGHWNTPEGFIEPLRDAFPRLAGTDFFFEYNARAAVAAHPEIFPRRPYFLFQDYFTEVREHGLQIDIQKPVYWGRSVVLDICAPLACYMGFSEIYLIGCDCNWGIQTEIHNSTYSYAAERDRAFYDNARERDVSYLPTASHEVMLLDAYESVKNHPPSGARIYNAGVGGRLESFPRRDFASLFPASARGASDAARSDKEVLT